MNSVIRSAVFYNSSDKRPSHYHDCHQILFVTRGSADMLIDGEEISINAANLLITSRFESHSVVNTSADYERYILRTDPLLAADSGTEKRIFSLLFNRPQGFTRKIDATDKKEQFEALFIRICDEFGNRGRMSSELLDAYLSELLILIHRLLPEDVGGIYSENHEIISDIQRRFERDYMKLFRLDTLARQYGISPSYLSHRFKESTGVAVMEYLLDCRIAAAKKCLASTDTSIGGIVESCGFSDNSNFTRSFRRKTGLTPSQFRKIYRKG